MCYVEQEDTLKTAAAGTASLRYTNMDDGSENLIPVSQLPFRIGRSIDNAVAIPDNQVSRRHARIEMVDGGYALLDLESKNGTWLNGSRVVGHSHSCAMPLKNDDMIQIGTAILHVVLSAVEPPESTRRCPTERLNLSSILDNAETAQTTAYEDEPTAAAPPEV